MGLNHGAIPGGRRLAAAVVLAGLGLLMAACQSASPTSSGRAGMVQVEPQQDWADAIVYFVLVDRFADGDPGNNLHYQPDNPGGWHGGDLKGLAAQLDEIAELGATAIWINPVQRQIEPGLPVNPIPEAGVTSWFEHWGFHGYWMDDFKAMDPHFGSEADLAALVEAAHARGIKVLLDVVYNHAGYGAKYEVSPEYAGWIRKERPGCDADPLRCRVGGLPDFVTEKPEVAEYLLEANLGLAGRTGVDGFRLDTVKHIDHDFWKAHRERASRELGEDFFLLGEVWGGSAQVLDPYFEGDELDAGFDFTFRGSCRDFIEGRMRTVAYSAYLEKRHRVRDGYHLAHYLSSHDEPMQLYQLGGDLNRFRLCVAAQMTTLGIPVIYYGEEVARAGSVWPTNRKDMPWGERDVEPGAGVSRDEALRDYYRRLIQLRRAHPSLSRGDYTRLYTEGDLLVFRRDAADDTVVVAINRGESAARAEVPAPEGWGRAEDGLTGEVMEAAGESLTVQVPPLTARVLVRASD
ncbi:MAG: alpha-amylase family glycosyl hydrolase [Gammaproteobacteria bacterium]